MKNGWPMVPLGEVLTRSSEWIPIHADQSYREVTVRLWGKGVTLRRECSGSEIKSDRRLRVRPNQFIASRIDARNGAFGLIPPELDGAVVTNDFPVFTPHDQKLLPQYLGWMSRTRSFVEMCIRASEGTTNRVRLKEDRFLAMAVPLPHLSEQRRIVARIESLAAKIAEARRFHAENVDAIRVLLHSELGQLFTSLEECHGVRELDSVITEAGYGTSIKCNYERSAEGVPVLRIPNVASETTNLSDLKFGTIPNGERLRVTLDENDLLIVRTNGSPDLVGRCAVVRGLVEPTAFASYLIRIKFDRKSVDPDFVQLMLRYLRDSGQLIDFARTTAGQYNVSLGRLRSASIPLPPLVEQRRIVAHLDALTAKTATLKQLQSQSAAELEALLPSILDRAFKGEL